MTFPNMNTLIDANVELGAALVDARVERDYLAARVEKLEAALKYIKEVCVYDRLEGHVIQRVASEALKGGK